jgi:predicted aldo/keto reductase-like oxidoreductase
MAVYAEARRVMAAKIKADCTACRYCMPCPSGVDIPGVMEALNAASMWGDPNPWMCGYVVLKGKASLCTECGQCLDMCPQGLPIPDLMAEAVATFENTGRPA